MGIWRLADRIGKDVTETDRMDMKGGVFVVSVNKYFLFLALIP